jgi:uncharacterized membrane protein
MDPVHLHLMLNHFPVIGMVLGFFLFLLAVRKRSGDLIKASLGGFILLAVLAVPTYLSGAWAEEGVEHLPGVSESIIGQHEDAAAVALIGVAILGIMSLTGLMMFRKQGQFPAWFMMLTLALSLVTVGMMAYTGNLGGKVRHTELRNTPAQSAEADHGEGHNKD